MFSKILCLVRSVYFNLRYLPFEVAVKFPFKVMTRVKVQASKGQIKILNPRRFAVILGGGSPGMQHFDSVIFLASGSNLMIDGSAIFGQGTNLRCDEGASIHIGDRFYCNCNCYFRSNNSISFGEDCALGWNVQINTTDGHPVYHHGKLSEMSKPVSIGRHVWITSNVIVSKGATVADGCIVAQGAVVNKSFTEQNVLLGGVPARQVADNVEWKK